MYIAEQGKEFDEYLAQNLAFWQEYSAAPFDAESVIYVDVAHDNPAYLLTNLWIAKYLQRFKPAKVVGLASRWPKAAPHFNIDALKRLTDSFLLDELIDLDTLEPDDSRTLEREFRDHIAGLENHALRAAVLNFGAARDPDLGWILYDTWLRQERIATFETVSEDLIECASRVFKARSTTMAAMRRGKCVAVVVGHYHYSPFAWMAREGVARGAPVYFQSLLLPVSIRRFANLDDFRHGRASDFVDVYEKKIRSKTNESTLRSFERRMFDIQKGVRQFFRVLPQAERLESRQDTLKALGLNSSFPVVCFFAPALCGPPHCFGPLFFDDNADWIWQSLQIAIDLPHINFLVRPHPQDATYDTSGFMMRCEKAFGGRDNICFVPLDISLDQLAQMCDVVVTVSGTPGYEMAARGVATVAAGPSRYSGLGFCQQPSDLEDYRALLQAPLEQPLHEEMRRQAIEFMFFEMFAGRSQASFIPGLHLAWQATFWTEATRCLRSTAVEEDPLYRNLGYMVRSDLPFLLNVDVTAQSDVMSPSPRLDVEAALSGLHAVSLAARRAEEKRAAHWRARFESAQAEQQAAWRLVASWLDSGLRVDVGRHASGNEFLTSGWSVPEEGGMWTDGDIATLSLPTLRTQCVLHLACYAIVPASDVVQRITVWQRRRRIAELEISSDTLQEVMVPVEAYQGRIDISLHIGEPVIPPYGTRRLGLWLSGFWLQAAP